MPAPHPVALRQRVVESYLAGEGTFREIGERFRVGEASVNRWVNQYRRTGHLKAKKKPKTGPQLVDEVGEAFLIETLEDIPDSTMVELVAAYLEEFGVKVSLSTMKRTVKLLGFTRKKGSSAHRRSNGQTLWRREKPS